MTFKKKYTHEMILKIIEEHSNIISTRQISDLLGCTNMTTDRILKDMLISKKIKRVNVGTEAKPVWIYSQTEMK